MSTICRNPAKTSRISLIWLCTALLHVCLSTDTGCAAQNEGRIGSISRAKMNREIPINSDQVRYVTAGADGFGLVVQNETGIEAKLYGRNANLRFTYSSPRGATESVRSIETSEDGSVVVIGALTSFESMEYHIFDSLGRPLFNFPTDAYVHPSPNGRLFCVQQSDFYHGPVTVLNSSREVLFSFDNPNAEWKAVFVNNDRLCVIDADSLRLFDLKTSTRLSTTALPFGGVGLAPYVRISRRDSALAVFDSKVLVVLSTEGKVKWQETYDDFLCTVAIEEHGGRLALLLTSRSRGYGYFSIVDLKTGAQQFASERIKELSSTTRRPFEHCWFSDATILLWGPLDSDLSWFEQPRENWTLFLDASTKVKTPSHTIQPGVYRPIELADNRLNLIRIQSNSPTALITVE